MHRKLIFNWRIMYIVTYTYSSALHLECKYAMNLLLTVSPFTSFTTLAWSLVLLHQIVPTDLIKHFFLFTWNYMSLKRCCLKIIKLNNDTNLSHWTCHMMSRSMGCSIILSQIPEFISFINGKMATSTTTTLSCKSTWWTKVDLLTIPF